MNLDKQAIEKHKKTKCIVEGKEYHEGQIIFPEKEDAYQCICATGFDNSTIGNNPHCEPIDCALTPSWNNNIQMGCTPVYFDHSCPFDWVCRKFFTFSFNLKYISLRIYLEEFTDLQRLSRTKSLKTLRQR